ncbi:hypothetical protein Mzhil_0723 [Methanosalsum zhilinae DSM 4017]|uniref:Uncharacterized protein n=1 Tax=Methanosalsum zhilinae (strain DSM 4017 / NBRC 107636 / OCM 62 / WeN5) TaxID=679901 RepID=F7XKB8_METZD|nr:hypothetical protein [Methanosalsum zhilinae]AEH60589.1 hypothetical protein Mzhil_0723 [Methanosalsum zhilinae DSM 4017]
MKSKVYEGDNRTSMKVYTGNTTDFLSNIRVSLADFNENWSVLVTGMDEQTRAAAAISLAQALDPNFTVEQCAFSIQELKQIMHNINVKTIVLIEQNNENKLSEVLDAASLPGKLLIVTSPIKPPEYRMKKIYNLHVYLKKEISNEENNGGIRGVQAIAMILKPSASMKLGASYNKSINIFNSDIAMLDIMYPLTDVWNQYTNLKESKRS